MIILSQKNTIMIYEDHYNHRIIIESPLLINDHATGTDEDWRYLPCIRPIYQAYVMEYAHRIWPEIWYSTPILGSWNFH